MISNWGQGGITCGAINEPTKSSKAIDECVIINFRDKNVVIARFRDKNVVIACFHDKNKVFVLFVNVRTISNLLFIVRKSRCI